MTSRNSVMATCTPWTVVSRSRLMSLIITFMFEPAKLQMNCARASGTSTRRTVVAGVAALAVSAMRRRHGSLGRRHPGGVERPVGAEDGGDEGPVGGGLREVGDRPPGRVDLLGVEAEVVPVGEHLREREAGLVEPPRAGERVDVEERAEREGALRARQPVW